MNRIRRRLFKGLAAGFLLIIFASLFLMIRSLFVSDTVNIINIRARNYQVSSSAGEIGMGSSQIVEKLFSKSPNGAVAYSENMMNPKANSPSGLAYWGFQKQKLDLRFHFEHVDPQGSFIVTGWKPGHQATLHVPTLRGWNLSIPDWAMCLAAIILLWQCRVQYNRRPPPGTCVACGYDLRATPDRCPECGTIPPKKEPISR